MNRSGGSPDRRKPLAAPTAGGLAGGFFRAILQGDEQALVDATNVDNIPVPATVDTTL